MTDTNHIEVLRKRMTELQRLAEYHAQRTADELAGIEREQTAITAAITALSARASAVEAVEIIEDAIKLASDGVTFGCPADVADWMRDALAEYDTQLAAGEGELRWVVDGRVFGKPTGPDALEYADKNWHADSWSDTRIARLKNIHAAPQPAQAQKDESPTITSGGIVEVNPAKAIRYAYQQGNVKKTAPQPATVRASPFICDECGKVECCPEFHDTPQPATGED